MPRYIDADAAWKRFYELAKEQSLHPRETAFNTEYVLDFIEAIETADVEEVRHGRWIQKVKYRGEDKNFKTFYYKICSECHRSPNMKYNRLTPRCPWCGAKMDLKGEAEK